MSAFSFSKETAHDDTTVVTQSPQQNSGSSVSDNNLEFYLKIKINWTSHIHLVKGQH